MDKCPMCGARLQQGLNYCEACGADITIYQNVYNDVLNNYSQPTQTPGYQPSSQAYQQTQYQTCPHCGAQIPQGVQFCPSCGKEVKKRRFW